MIVSGSRMTLLISQRVASRVTLQKRQAAASSRKLTAGATASSGARGLSHESTCRKQALENGRRAAHQWPLCQASTRRTVHISSTSLSVSKPAPSAASPSLAEVSARPTESGPSAEYDRLVSKGVLTDDSFQRSIVARLQGLHDQLKTYKQKPPKAPSNQPKSTGKGLGGLFSSLFSSKSHAGDENDGTVHLDESVPKGMYLYGDVGTGKSMLMDLFYNTLPASIKRKRRIHFHQFMISAHKRVHYFKSLHHKPSGMVVSATTAVLTNTAAALGTIAGGPARETALKARKDAEGQELDTIEPVAREIASECEVLCFDEFQVTDIADAMILRRLMEYLVANGVVIVITSNRHPKDLYKNGIQRSSFIPCIELLQQGLQVVDLDSGTDYRKVPKALSKVYFDGNAQEDHSEFEKIWTALTSDEQIKENRRLQIWGRDLIVPQSTSRIARFTFTELCGSPKAAADYIEICRRFHTIFIDQVPRMGLHQRDLARRFITFIDSVYESKSKLILSSEGPILQIFSADASAGKPTEGAMRSLMDDLGLTMDDIGGNPIFTGEEELFAFARVISRLSEMNTVQYAQSVRIVDEAPPEA
ncbi:hypothetical protein K437DRAFT_235752 [Tilletiaria anomala UBC 951]|uniref:AFG1-like ATPase n=1 Tax=Tilletiaria anomala (strain ATCC 24038 / CBS 436.72 / UBC 951) TaxID=1037660 RepID=A0A066VV37_TILAU|nr:uncharacterized protein K437DRAFT_235752 [Tilletiaria anomala UBC 951]KDN45597.1 hypothetical protein K437DRAFT_235752 [Tilletiaria anomala UBC 951]